MPEWVEPERWHKTVCNFLQLLAWVREITPRYTRRYTPRYAVRAQPSHRSLAICLPPDYDLIIIGQERSVEMKTGRLFPTARLQILRDLYIREWQATLLLCW